MRSHAITRVILEVLVVMDVVTASLQCREEQSGDETFAGCLVLQVVHCHSKNEYLPFSCLRQVASVPFQMFFSKSICNGVQ